MYVRTEEDLDILIGDAELDIKYVWLPILLQTRQYNNRKKSYYLQGRGFPTRNRGWNDEYLQQNECVRKRDFIKSSTGSKGKGKNFSNKKKIHFCNIFLLRLQLVSSAPSRNGELANVRAKTELNAAKKFKVSIPLKRQTLICRKLYSLLFLKPVCSECTKLRWRTNIW